MKKDEDYLSNRNKYNKEKISNIEQFLTNINNVVYSTKVYDASNIAVDFSKHSEELFEEPINNLVTDGADRSLSERWESLRSTLDKEKIISLEDNFLNLDFYIDERENADLVYGLKSNIDIEKVKRFGLDPLLLKPFVDRDKISKAVEYGKKHEKEKNGISKLRVKPDKSRLDDLESLHVLGLDIKITPEDEVKFIEVNGLHSTMDGFRKGGISYEESLGEKPTKKSFAKYLEKFREKTPMLKSSGEKYGREKLVERIREYGRSQLVFLSGLLNASGIRSGKTIGGENLMALDSIKLPSGRKGIDLVNDEYFERYGEIAENMVENEIKICDKLMLQKIFEKEGLESYKPSSVLFKYLGEDYIEKLAKENDSAVVKPRVGARGNNVEFMNSNDIDEKLKSYRYSLKDKDLIDQYLAEPFVRSKPIKKEIDSHDGCMRYVVLVEKEKGGDLNMERFGGYWRLAPEPFRGKDKKYSNKRSRLANLDKNAKPKKPSEKDLKKVEEVINEVIPRYYKSLTETSFDELDTLPKKTIQDVEIAELFDVGYEPVVEYEDSYN